MSATSKSIGSIVSPAAGWGSGFIIGPWADIVLIIGAPIVALMIAGPLFVVPASVFETELRGKPQDLRQIFITTFINAHLFLVFFRSHANPSIFRLHPIRFVVVPIAMIGIGASSRIVFGLMGFVAIWWDVYHSSMQTFGFGRIYDAKCKNDAVIGRNLDYWMNLLVYLGPVLAGVNLAEHLRSSSEGLQFLLADGNSLNSFLLQKAPNYLLGNQFCLAVGILAVGIPFVFYYVYAYYRLQSQGYRVSWQKIWLMILTSAVSIYCWGFCRAIDAFWVMNFFHALQYFAIVGFAEQRNLTRLFRIEWFSCGSALALFWVVSFCLVYGLWSGFFASDNWSTSAVLTTSIMHFWYDGFIWSVKKKQV